MFNSYDDPFEFAVHRVPAANHDQLGRMKTLFKVFLLLLMAMGGQVMAATCTSKASGNWNSSGTWNCTSGTTPASGDTVVLVSPYTVNLNGSDRTIATITINSGATLDDDGRQLNVTASVVNNGTFGLNNGSISPSANATIAGTGYFDNTDVLVDATGVVISVGANLRFTNSAQLRVGRNNTGSLTINGTIDGTALSSGSRFVRVYQGDSVIVNGTITGSSTYIQIDQSATVTNNGTVTVQELNSGNNNSVWTQGANSSLTVSQTNSWNGTLNASANNNTITYTADVTAMVPTSNTYYNVSHPNCTKLTGFTILGTSPCASSAPTATTNAASSIGVSGATLNGTVSSNGGSTTVTFAYGLTTSYGSTATASTSPLASNASNSSVSAAVTGLTCNTLYHFRVAATNSKGTTNGSDLTFTTSACPPPTVVTNPATALAVSGATLNGTVSTAGSSAVVTFDYGLTTGYGTSATASASPLASGSSNSAVSASITGLTCNTLYHFRVKAVNGGGTASGSDATFTTSACPVPAVVSINRADFSPAKSASNVNWTVVFNLAVTGVDAADFALVASSGATGTAITSVSGSGTTYTVTASSGNAGSLGLNLVDNDTINSGGGPLGGVGVNGNFTGQIYAFVTSPCTGASDILFCDDFERSNSGTLGNGWTVTPASATNCTGAAGNTGCAGIDSDIPPFNTYTNPRANASRSMFTRWSTVSVDSPVVSLAGKSGAQLSFWMRRGRDTFSECPEAVGENYLVQYYASNNTWKILAQYPSSPSAALCDGQIFTPVIELPPDALHANFKMRFYQPSGSGRSGSGGAPGVVGYDYWHMDDVVIRATTGPSFVGAFCDNFEAGLGRWSITAESYVSGNIGDAKIGTLAFQSAGHELDLRWGYVTASTFKTNMTGVSGNITYWVRSGTTSALDPISGQDLVAEYLNSTGAWTTLATYPGSAAAGTVYNASFVLPGDATHANFRLRFRQVAGSGYDKSYWHIDDVCVGNSIPNTDLALTKTGESTLVPGATTNYTLRATNNGPDALSGSAQIVDTLPNGLTYISGGGGSSGWACSAPSQNVTCTWTGTLAVGASAPNLVITAAVGATVTGSVTNTATLSSTGNDPNTGNNTASFSSGNFIPYFIFTSGTCVDGIAIGNAAQTCSYANWSSMVAGQAKTAIYITAVNASGVPTKLSSSSSTTVTTQFGLTCHDPIANAGVQATFTATAAALPLCTGNGAQPTVWSTATSLTFAAGSPTIATAYTFTYADVGQIELYMRNSVATTQVGKSNPFVVRPAGFVVTGVKCTTYAAGSCATAAIASPGNNPGATTASGTAFVQAGQAFSATVTALTLSGKTKADAGTTINCTSTPTDCTPNFGKENVAYGGPESVLLSVDNYVSSMVSPPDLAGSFGAFSGGIATATDLSWDEVGIITMTPSIRDGDYLGAGDVTGKTTGAVGRFYPDHFDTVVDQISGVPMACPDGLCPSTFNGIVYSGQTFNLSVTAMNASGNATVNYDTTAGFSKTAVLTPYGALGTTSAPSGAGALAVASMSAFVSGARTEAAEKYTFTTTPTAPTNIYINASDGEANSRRTANPTTTSIEGGVRVVSGRISIPNMYGSERLQLPLTATVQYYNGTNWVTSLTDSVTSFSSALSPGGNLVASNATCAVVKTPDIAPVAVSAGARTLVFSRVAVTPPAPKCITTFSINAPSYLPSSTGSATFGVFKSPLIYRRENY